MHLLADAGVPMIAIYWPPAWIALIPVVAIEAWWAHRVLSNGWGKAIGTTLAANLVSTLIGIPLAWFIWAILELRYFGGPWALGHPAGLLFAVPASSSSSASSSKG